MTVFGSLIFTILFSHFYLVLVSIEMIYQTPKAMFGEAFIAVAVVVC